jgi:hypothetical protein
VEELMAWLKPMAAQIPGPDGLTETQRSAHQTAQTEAVLAV